MKKQIKLTLVLLALSHFITAQDTLEEIFRSSQNFNTIVERGNQHFAEKHPDKTPQELTSGEHRDGKYVKFQRWQAFWKNRLDENGNLGDISKYFRERNANSRSNNNQMYDNVVWSEVNYNDYITGQIGLGRTTSIGFHPTDPNTWYVGAAIGGIWRTIDNGQSYTPLGDDLPFLAVSSIVVDRVNPDVIYIAISDHVWYGPSGIGVYKTTDGGMNWQPTSLSFDFTQDDRIYWMEADPTDNNHILVATSDGLYETTNGFNSNTKILSNSCFHVRFHETNSNIVYLGDRSGRFYRSTNGGSSFSLVQDFGNGDTHVDVGHNNNSIVYVKVGNELHRSSDNGSSFTQQGTMSEGGEVFKVALFNDDIIISGNFDTYRSNNGGSSFTQISDWLGAGGLPLIHVDQRNIFVNPLQTNYVYYCNDGGVYRYNINTGSFENLSDGLKITQYYDIAVSQTDPNVIGGGSQDNGNVFRTSAGVWQQYATTGDGMNQEINADNANIRYWSYQYGSINRWQNGSNTSIIPNGESGAWETPYRLDPSNQQRLIIAYQEVYESMNNGSSWTAISGNLAGGDDLEELAIAPTNGERIYVVRGSNLYVKSLTDNTWTTKTLPASSISDIEVDFRDEDKLYISVSGYNSGSKVWMSSDAGDIWNNISGSLPNISTGAIELLEGTEGGIFVGNDDGVYYRDDVNTEWAPYGNLPNTRVEDIEIQYASSLIRVGTHGRGVLEAPLIMPYCYGVEPDSDNDGVCDAVDQCPNLDNSLFFIEPCDDGDDFSQGEVYASDCNCADGAAFETYCSASGTSGTGADWISRVELNTINHSSTQSGYSDFREYSTRLNHGDTYTLDVELNYVFSPDRVRAWIDFDRSGVFDSDESIIMGEQAVNNVFTGSFAVPLDAVAGAVTLRVRNVYSTTSNDPCSNEFGEVEDYTVRLMCVPASTNADCITLPLDWVSFTARALEDEKAKLDWSTVNEEGVSHFDIERANDGKTFTKIGRISAKNALSNTYSFIDESVRENLAYYRLRSVDVDGTEAITEIRVVHWDNDGYQPTIYPNPTSSSLTITAKADKARVMKWRVLDLQGRTKLIGVRSIADERTEALILVDALPVGAYILEVEDLGETHMMRFVKEMR